MGSQRQSFGQIAVLPDIAGMYGFITFALLVIFDSGKALLDGDTLWHIAAGKHMLADRAILTRDIFSHTAFGKPWTAHEWLSEIIMAWLHQHTGLIGVVVFFFLIAALSFWLLFRMVATVTNEWIATLAVSVALTFSMAHLLARPHVFSWLFGVISLFALYKQGRWLWLLPPLTAVWANLHGGFILGLALQGLFIGGTLLEDILTKQIRQVPVLWQQVKRPTVFFVLSILAAGINPFGFKLYLFPFQVTNKVFSASIMEWLSPNLQEDWLFRFFVLLMLLLMSLKRTSTNWTDRLFVLFFFNAALTHQRYMGMASVFVCPYFAKSLESLPWPRISFFGKKSEGKQLQTSSISGPVLTIMLAMLLGFLSGPSFPHSRDVLETFLPLPDTNHPIEAIQHLKKTHPSGKMFNKYSWGGHLIYELGPERKVFIDGRADMYGAEIFSDYQKIISLDKKAELLLKRYDIDWILYPVDSALVRYLKATGSWQETYADEKAAILVRRNEPTNLFGTDKKH
ncbi:hypothetical protein Pcar_1756 [Syntrophotalea carbinolica DSM 2380]|uniref:Glycosyltransferase RgtA/B/C/D-like domain-containing protein n=1 Tax=Syntrophotalea carbinolica (strain DSM 2380 / NBRC 103641 / GraBd1) TaxID=338963 RepID=Q3A3Q8_SYNC1|nr:hypothetical protein [Syntrophotalea carbinolica]ABA88999.1 hypothetical protein Pcar_1756 [Syntrophotalea carbinolica DSM 2380]